MLHQFISVTFIGFILRIENARPVNKQGHLANDTQCVSSKYVLNTTNLSFLFISLPSLKCNLLSTRVVNMPCQFEIEIPLLCIKDMPRHLCFSIWKWIYAFDYACPATFSFYCLCNCIFRKDFTFCGYIDFLQIICVLLKS